MAEIPQKVDRSVVDEFLAKLGLDLSSNVRQVTIIPGGIEVVQMRKTQPGRSGVTYRYGREELATVTTRIEVAFPKYTECPHTDRVICGYDGDDNPSLECLLCGYIVTGPQIVSAPPK
ncbi:hypothetical protein CH249_01895 [Rhodococcus sp. 05-2255-3B1]|uniref:hypothetical protein n=1 Tax=unclassified Rhodococcus (in: high G+C Gram-positive bacteria) TaxID=192944 RepID=UPI000B9BFDC5|nr:MULTISPECIES: hypothetical protein [unclassified Rhodococcus (in: high G+C Gram-positive bacteria)]OZE13364.1 hypothetical protein CH250_05470 [Rhodococcus sp. 05-2255-3C]OZE16024.1 hypothetical protein CH249_01895 [Rhodococcus sp. 05-2255-3B1]OZE19064.1 hypothetical protein CH255_13920 [Rhodococcus sp. 05-2255-2A2]